jgi:hypothetical protein
LRFDFIHMLLISTHAEILGRASRVLESRVCLTLDVSIVSVCSILLRGNPIQSWRMTLRSEL